MRRLIITAAALALALPATVSAATPETATVSAASPKAGWTGTIQGGILFHNTYNYEPAGTLPCQAPGCDTFTLQNAEGNADLLIEVASEQSPDISLRIQDPSGTWTYHNGWSDSTPATKVRLKKAPKGTYVINVVIRRLGTTQPTAVDDTSDYTGTATLLVAAPVITPPSVPPATTPAPDPPAKPAPAKKPSAKAACQKKAKKIKNKRKRKAALKRCAKKR